MLHAFPKLHVMLIYSLFKFLVLGIIQVRCTPVDFATLDVLKYGENAGQQIMLRVTERIADEQGKY